METSLSPQMSLDPGSWETTDFDHELERAFVRAHEKLLIKQQGGCIPDFDIRGELYRLAFRIAPEARSEELQEMLNSLEPEAGEQGIDLAAGTGFLSKEVTRRTGACLYAIDPSQEQLRSLADEDENIKPLCLSPDDLRIHQCIGKSSIDFVSCLGGLHHISNQEQLFRNIRDLLRPGGRFVAADVCAGTTLASHFDSVVAAKCITGHTAKWLDEGRLELLANMAGLRVLSCRRMSLKWHFDSFRQMALFFKALHAYDVGLEEIISDIEQELGIVVSPERIEVLWPLLVFDVRKPLR